MKRNKLLLFVLLLLLNVGELFSQQGLGKITISNDGRYFERNGQRYIPYGDFLWNEESCVTADGYNGVVLGGVTHKFFSSKLSSSDRTCVLNYAKELYNSINIYVINENDYDVDGDWHINARPDRWEQWAPQMISRGLTPIVWVFPDDSPSITNRPMNELKDHIDLVTSVWNKYDPLYILALQADDSWDPDNSGSASIIQELGEFLVSKAGGNPVGHHEKYSRDEFYNQNWIEWNALQTWRDNFEDAIHFFKEMYNKYPDRPNVMMEYEAANPGGNEGERRAIAITSLEADAAGLGTGPAGIDIGKYENHDNIPDNQAPAPPTGVTIILKDK